MKNEAINKELVTVHQIHKDLTYTYKKELIGNLLSIVGLLIIMLIYSKGNLANGFRTMGAFYAILLVFAVLACVHAVASVIRLVNVKNINYTIVKDVVVDKKDREVRYRGKHAHVEPYELLLETHGSYQILDGKYYTWSKQQKTDANGLYYFIHRDDEVFLVFGKGREIVMIYSANLFECVEQPYGDAWETLNSGASFGVQWKKKRKTLPLWKRIHRWTIYGCVGLFMVCWVILATNVAVPEYVMERIGKSIVFLMIASIIFYHVVQCVDELLFQAGKARINENKVYERIAIGLLLLLIFVSIGYIANLTLALF